MGYAYTVYSWWTYLISRLLLGGRGRARKALLAPASSTWRRCRTSAQNVLLTTMLHDNLIPKVPIQRVRMDRCACGINEGVIIESSYGRPAEIALNASPLHRCEVLNRRIRVRHIRKEWMKLQGISS